MALALGLQQPGEREQLIRSLQLPGPIEREFLMPWGSISALTQQLEESGLCKSEIKFLQGYRISSAYFASCIARFKKGSHVGCTETKRIAYQPTGDYYPKHVNANNCVDSNCSFIEGETEKISPCEGERLPSFRLDATDSKKVISISDFDIFHQRVSTMTKVRLYSA